MTLKTNVLTVMALTFSLFFLIGCSKESSLESSQEISEEVAITSTDVTEKSIETTKESEGMENKIDVKRASTEIENYYKIDTSDVRDFIDIDGEKYFTIKKYEDDFKECKYKDEDGIETSAKRERYVAYINSYKTGESTVIFDDYFRFLNVIEDKAYGKYIYMIKVQPGEEAIISQLNTETLEEKKVDLSNKVLDYSEKSVISVIDEQKIIIRCISLNASDDIEKIRNTGYTIPENINDYMDVHIVATYVYNFENGEVKPLFYNFKDSETSLQIGENVFFHDCSNDFIVLSKRSHIQEEKDTYRFEILDKNLNVIYKSDNFTTDKRFSLSFTIKNNDIYVEEFNGKVEDQKYYKYVYENNQFVKHDIKYGEEYLSPFPSSKYNYDPSPDGINICLYEQFLCTYKEYENNDFVDADLDKLIVVLPNNSIYYIDVKDTHIPYNYQVKSCKNGYLVYKDNYDLEDEKFVIYIPNEEIQKIING